MMLAIACVCIAPSLLIMLLGVILAIDDMCTAIRRALARRRRLRRDLARGRFVYEAMRARQRRYAPPKGITGVYR